MSPFITIKNVKLGNMRKAADWVICPVSGQDEKEVTIQCDRRIARINLATGRGVISNGKGGHQGFMQLSPILGSFEIEVPAAIIEELAELVKDRPVGPVRIV